MNNLADGIECHLVKKTSRIMNGMAGNINILWQTQKRRQKR